MMLAKESEAFKIFQAKLAVNNPQVWWFCDSSSA